MRSLQGQLLVASPYLRDSNFAETVVLVLRHDAQGAVGVVLNRPMGHTVGQFFKQLEAASSCDSERPVHFGGPQPGPLLAVHDCRSLAELEVPPGIYVAAERDHLRKLVQNDRDFVVFVGHARWTHPQLETELARGDWMVARAEAEHVFGEDPNLWSTVVRQIGRSLWESLGIKRIPPDPTYN